MKMNLDMITTFDFPDHRVVKSLGIVRGISVRSPGFGGGIRAVFQSIFSGNVSTFTKLCEKTRSEAFELLVKHAEELWANAIIGLRFDANEVTKISTEVLAYGTAVIVEKR